MLDRRGVALVEFALALPIMLLLYVGGLQVAGALARHRKVTIAARSVADMVTQRIVLTAGEVDDILTLPGLIVAPSTPSTTHVEVSAFKTEANGATHLVWSRASNGTPFAAGPVNLPSDLAQQGRSLIRVRVRHRYRLIQIAGLPQTLELSEELYMAPRLSNDISCADCGGAASAR
ncbi:MAG: pilus assembly protein [Sphingomonas paucimobilis]